MPVRNFDNKALAASVRVLEDALLHEGLILRAVRQLVLNWVGAHRECKAKSAYLVWRVASAHPRSLATVSGSTPGSIILDRRPASGTPLGVLSEPISGRVTGAPVASGAVRRLVCTPATDSAGPYPLSYITSTWLRATT